MNKPSSLKQHLIAAVPELRGNPDKILVFIDQGRIRSTTAPGLSFEYAYTLNLILTDFAGHPDAVAVPLLAWLLTHQPDLMENLEKAKDAIQFEADILADDLVDLSITLPLTERVIVKRQADGTHNIAHAQEPQLTEQLPATAFQLYAGTELLAEWTSLEPNGGAALATPHPVPNRG